MILASDLRVGNKFRGVAGVQTVLSIEDNTNRNTLTYVDENHKLMYSHLILCLENENQYKPCEIEGIELTDEILMQYGFIGGGLHSFTGMYLECSDHPRIYKHISINYNNDKSYPQYYAFMREGRKDEPRESDGVVCLRSDLRYLHQLQNLFYTINGTELQIKL